MPAPGGLERSRVQISAPRLRKPAGNGGFFSRAAGLRAQHSRRSVPTPAASQVNHLQPVANVFPLRCLAVEEGVATVTRRGDQRPREPKPLAVHLAVDVKAERVELGGSLPTDD